MEDSGLVAIVIRNDINYLFSVMRVKRQLAPILARPSLSCSIQLAMSTYDLKVE
tara:strand:+ start:301 stop:462 length:162 start_codon:yes stop_codon:yes gene_type:complete